MKLNRPAGEYFKFRTIGDMAEGTFVDFRENVPGKFGPETFIDLQAKEGLLHIRCGTMLRRTFTENRKQLQPGVRIRIEFSSEIPSTKGAPCKLFDVDLEPALTPAAASVSADVHDDDVPF